MGRPVEGRAKFLSQSLLRHWEAESVAQVKMIGSALARHLGGEEAEVVRHLVQRVSILLTKVNSNLLLNRTPNNVPPNIDGNN